MQKKDDKITELVASLKISQEELQQSQEKIAQQQQQSRHLQDEAEHAKQQKELMQKQFDAQLTSTVMENKRLEREWLVAQETLKAMETKVSEMKKVEDQLQAAEAQVDTIKGKQIISQMP